MSPWNGPNSCKGISWKLRAYIIQMGLFIKLVNHFPQVGSSTPATIQFPEVNFIQLPI